MRLIDADKLDVYEMRFRSALELQDYLSTQETISAVRCGECKYSYIEETTLVCGNRGFFVEGAWFCADSEREGEEDE